MPRPTTDSAHLLCGLLLLSGSLLAQRRDADPRYTPAYFDSIRSAVNDTTIARWVVQAYRLGPDAKIIIDGHLDEGPWHQAQHTTGFLEKDPYPLIEFNEPTEFAILYDDENIYVGIWCWDSQPGKIIGQINPRGAFSPDNLQIFFDTYHDHRTGYKFTVSPTGVQMDELRYDDYKRDHNWNGIWYSAGHIDGQGWYAELKIPFFNFRFRDSEEQVWGSNIIRTISRNASQGSWKPHLPEWEISTRMSKLGHIVGLRDLKAGRRFEIRPYGVSGASQNSASSLAGQLNTGLDLRFSPVSNITADLTLNPDFAQVDADVLEINLSRYPTRFRELRPFFTEGTNIFNSPMELFYSRRIGARGDILGGAKLTGKFDNGLEFGSLMVLTGRSRLSNLQFADVDSVAIDREEASFAVFRVKKDLLRSSSIGLLGATKEKAGEYNRVLGLDGSFTLTNQYLLNVQAASGATEETGALNKAYSVQLKRTGDLFSFVAHKRLIQPDFKINRVGYLRKESYRGSDLADISALLSPRIDRYGIRRIRISSAVTIRTDLLTDRYIDDWLEDEPDLEPDSVFGTVLTVPGSLRAIDGGQRQFRNLSHSESVTVIFLSEAVLRLGYSKFSATELTGNYRGGNWQASFRTRSINLGRRFSGTISANGGAYYNFSRKYVGTQRTLHLSGRGRLRYNLLSTLEGEVTHSYDDTDRRDGEYLQLSSYSTWMFTKDFSLRVHLQGHFGTTYYGEPETANRYLFSTLLSWEYRPGSFFYLAYNEVRRDEDAPDKPYERFNLDTRTILLKLSYRLNI